MPNKILTNLLISELEKLQPVLKTKVISSHVIIRCPFCGDSKKHEDSAHLYISTIKEGYSWDCKLCVAAGHRLSYDLLEKIGATNNIELVEGIKKNSFHIVSRVINLNERMKRLDVKLPIRIITSKRNMSKFEYLKTRMQHNFMNTDDILKYRIIYSLNEFIRLNKIKVKQKNNELVSMLEKYYVGFLSFFGNSITFRLIDDELQSKGFEKYYVYSFSDIVRQPFVYMPSIPIDPLSTHPKIHISESIFDLIGSKLRYKLDDNYDTIYISAQSIGAFKRAIKHALLISGYFGAEIDCYIDNDNKAMNTKEVDLTMITKSLKNFNESFKINIYTPKGIKDFGDLRQKIDIIKIKLSNMF